MAFIRVKLVVDKEENRVVFAEAEKDFVDVLLSFLTLPMGTIVRLLNKRSSIKCMDKLYESVENLDVKYFETEACKDMLLKPRSTAERLCEDLFVYVVDDLNPRRFYRCPTFACFTDTSRLYSSVCGVRCPCGKPMDKGVEWTPKNNDGKNYVFLKGAATYVISDDLNVAPGSVTATLSLLQKLGIKDATTLETRIVNVRRVQIFAILRRLLVSKTPLTDVFLRRTESIDYQEEECELIETPQIKSEGGAEAVNLSKTISMKLLQNKRTGKIVSAEAGNDFADVLLSFLTFPLGSIVKLLDKHSSVGCVDNLYTSVEVLSAGNDCIMSTESKNMLLSPKLYPHFNCNNQVLGIEANVSIRTNAHGCQTCWFNVMKIDKKTKCKHNIDVVTTNEVNPKLPNSSTKNGGGYAKNSVRFTVTDDMAITPLSPASAIDVIKQLKEPISNLVEKEVTLGEAKVLDLLKASLISSCALNRIFSPKKPTNLS